MYNLIFHNSQTVSLVRTQARQGKSVRHKGPIRDRVLVQMTNGKAMVIRGSLIISNAEIARIIAGVPQ